LADQIVCAATKSHIGGRRLRTSVHASFVDNPINAVDIPRELDPRLVDGARTQQQRLVQLSPTQRAALVLERYPELRALPGCDGDV
jgi:hypothetical protein